MLSRAETAGIALMEFLRLGGVVYQLSPRMSAEFRTLWTSALDNWFRHKSARAIWQSTLPACSTSRIGWLSFRRALGAADKTLVGAVSFEN